MEITSPALAESETPLIPHAPHNAYAAPSRKVLFPHFNIGRIRHKVLRTNAMPEVEYGLTNVFLPGGTG